MAPQFRLVLRTGKRGGGNFWLKSSLFNPFSCPKKAKGIFLANESTPTIYWTYTRIGKIKPALFFNTHHNAMQFSFPQVKERNYSIFFILPIPTKRLGEKTILAAFFSPVTLFSLLHPLGNITSSIPIPFLPPMAFDRRCRCDYWPNISSIPFPAKQEDPVISEEEESRGARERKGRFLSFVFRETWSCGALEKKPFKVCRVKDP